MFRSPNAGLNNYAPDYQMASPRTVEQLQVPEFAAGGWGRRPRTLADLGNSQPNQGIAVGEYNPSMPNPGGPMAGYSGPAFGSQEFQDARASGQHPIMDYLRQTYPQWFVRPNFGTGFQGFQGQMPQTSGYAAHGGMMPQDPRPMGSGYSNVRRRPIPSRPL